MLHQQLQAEFYYVTKKPDYQPLLEPSPIVITKEHTRRGLRKIVALCMLLSEKHGPCGYKKGAYRSASELYEGKRVCITGFGEKGHF